MPTLVEQIELYLKELIKRSKGGSIEIRRSDLAEAFNCAPSQINYVLATRFSPERGFLIETRRGGGGYLRISRVATEYNQILKHMHGCSDQSTLDSFIIRLYEDGFLTKRETSFIREMLKPDLNLEQRQKEIFSSQILKAIAILLREG